MNNREVIVRIVTPSEQPHLPKVESIPLPRENKNSLQKIINGAALTAIAVIGIFLAVGYFNLGLSLRDILVIVGIPLALGIITSYAIF